MYMSVRSGPPNATHDVCRAGTRTVATTSPAGETRTTSPAPQSATQTWPSASTARPSGRPGPSGVRKNGSRLWSAQPSAVGPVRRTSTRPVMVSA